MDLEKLLETAKISKSPVDYIEVGRAYEFRAENNEDLKQAKKWYKKAADRNNVDGALSLARIYEQDWDSKRSKKLAFKYYMLAADLGSSSGMQAVGWCFLTGDGVDQDRDKGLSWLEKSSTEEPSYVWAHIFFEYSKCDEKSSRLAAKKWLKRILDSNDDSLILDLAFAYHYGEDIGSSPKLARKYFELAASLGNVDAVIEAAYCHYKGVGGKVSKKKAQEYLHQVWEQEEPSYHTKVADMYDDEEYFGKDPKTLFKWYERAAILGDSYAQTQIGRWYRDGEGVEKDLNQAEQWLIKAASQKNGSACFSLANLYRKKDWERTDYASALDYFKRALKYGIENAYSSIAWMYVTGQGVKQSYKKALNWYEKGIKNFDTRSHKGIAWMYEKGLGVPVDYEKAFQHNSIAAENGYGSSMASLGWMYENGFGCNKDIKKARKWYEEGAQCKDSGCINNLGSMYFHGRGVRKDIKKGIEYFRRAAELGSATANFNMAMEYALGRVVPEDFDKAHSHWEKSVLNQDAYLEPNCYYNFGVCHLWKLAGLQIQNAVKWFNIAIEKGVKEAHIMLGDVYRLGNGTPKDTELAEYHFKQAIKYGLYRAYGKLAEMYRTGDHFEVDQSLQKKYYSRAYENSTLDYKNNYAWLMSTSLNKRLRNGELALKVILEDIDESKREAYKVDTLAATYAELGDFDSAVREQKKANALYKKQEADPEKAGGLTRLAMYKDNVPFRE